MAQSHQAGDPTVTPENLLTSLLFAPDWTVDGLAEQILSAIAAQPTPEGQEFVLDADATTNRQSHRILRPLLACLATKSAAETATSPNLYGGPLSFKRTGPEGAVWILGQFDNRPGMVRAFLRRSTSPPQATDPNPAEPAPLALPLAP
jgi:hypothetical protein